MGESRRIGLFLDYLVKKYGIRETKMDGTLTIDIEVCGSIVRITCIIDSENNDQKYTNVVLWMAMYAPGSNMEYENIMISHIQQAIDSSI